MADSYQHWRDALAGLPVKINVNEPQPGYYKSRAGQDRPWKPVAIWRTDDGELKCRRAGEMLDPYKMWSWCAKNPVSKADAKHAFENGTWPGDAPPIGDNSGNMTPLETLKSYVQTAKEWLEKTPKVADQITCDQAGNTAAELIKLKGKADTERKEKIRPHLDAKDAINATYNDLIDEAAKLAKTIKRSTDAFLIAEQKRLEEEERKRFEAERKAAEAARKAVEDARAKQIEDDPALALASDEPELPTVPTAPNPVKAVSGGQRGRKVTLREYTDYVVEDYASALEWAKDKEAVVLAVEKVCKAAARDGITVPGVKIVKEKRAA